MRPSVSYEERLRRDRLYQISVARNGPNPAKENRHLVWLNPRSEKCELRLIKDREWAKAGQIEAQKEDEVAAAVKAVDEGRAMFQKKPDAPMDTGQSTQTKN